MHRLHAVAHVGQRPAHDHAHRVIEIGAAHLVGDRDRCDVGRAAEVRAASSGVSAKEVFSACCGYQRVYAIPRPKTNCAGALRPLRERSSTAIEYGGRIGRFRGPARRRFPGRRALRRCRRARLLQRPRNHCRQRHLLLSQTLRTSTPPRPRLALLSTSFMITVILACRRDLVILASLLVAGGRFNPLGGAL